MKALLYSDWERLETTDVPKPEPAEGEALIRVEACGLCGSEVECVQTRSPRRTPPLILGHEFTGVVEAVGAGAARFKPGDAVVANSVIPCGACAPCARGDTFLCRDRGLFGMTRPGACAEFVCAPEAVLLPRPEGMDPACAALAEPAANAVHVMRLLPGQPKASVFVFGAGMIGLLVAQAAKAMLGARVGVADLDPGRLEYAVELGADVAVNASEEDAARAAVEFSGADGVDYAVDAAGAAITKKQAVACVRPGGAVCWLGLGQDEMDFSSFSVTLPQKIVTGSYSATQEEFAQAVALLRDGSLRGGRAAARFSLDDAAKGFERMGDPESDVVKAIVTM